MKFPHWLSIIFVFVGTAIATAKSQSAENQTSSLERIVAKDLMAGKIAHILFTFNENDRKLSAKFLEALLTGTLPGFKAHPNGIRIEGALFDEPISLRNLRNPGDLWLYKCEFKQDVVFVQSRFAESIVFDDSTFHEAATFNGIKVAGVASFKNTSFAGPVDFRGSDIAAEFQANHAEFNDKEKGADFNSMRVGRIAVFTDAVFEGPVSFWGANISNGFEAVKTEFRDKDHEANFNGMKVGGITGFLGALFEGPVNFYKADVGGEFLMEQARFRNKKGLANFNQMKVDTANFQGAIFNGPSAFNNFRARESASFEKAVFEGPVNFTAADIASSFSAIESKFMDQGEGAGFNGMKIGDLASFTDAIFEGPVDFRAAKVVGNFQARRVQFRNSKGAVQLKITCGMRAIFTDATFCGPVSFADSSFLDLVIDSVNRGIEPVSELDLTRSSVKRRLSLDKLTIDDLIAPFLRVEGPAIFTSLTVNRSADLSDGEFTTLDLSRSIWPRHGKDGQSFQLRGLNYKYVKVDANQSKSHQGLLKLVKQSAFAADVYRNLEAFFVREGYSAHANEAFIDGKRRERKTLLHGIRYFGSLTLDRLVGYGRRPWQAGIPCAFFVALGCFLFPKAKMERQKPAELKEGDDPLRGYSRLWYSLGLFLPFVDLKSDRIWKPQDNRWFLRHYMRVHILLGWILIPILLAAISGLIK